MTTSIPLLVDVGAALEEATGVLQYALVFLFAAIPLVEILVVVPIAIGLGLHPLATGVVAFVGNAGSVYAVIRCYRRIANWLRRRDGSAGTNDRYARAQRFWGRYGLPGLSMIAPILTGVHVAALVALLAGSENRAVAGWMSVGIAAWTVLLVVASIAGRSLLGLF